MSPFGSTGLCIFGGYVKKDHFFLKMGHPGSILPPGVTGIKGPMTSLAQDDTNDEYPINDNTDCCHEFDSNANLICITRSPSTFIAWKAGWSTLVAWKDSLGYTMLAS